MLPYAYSDPGTQRQQGPLLIPRGHSDPGTPRLDNIWKPKPPPLPSHASFPPVQPYRSKNPRYPPPLHTTPEYTRPTRTSIAHVSMQNGLLYYEPPRNMGVQCPSIRDLPKSMGVQCPSIRDAPKSMGVQCPSVHVCSEAPEPQCRRRNLAMRIITWPWDCMESWLRRCFPITEETLRFLRAVWYVVVIFSTVLGIVAVITGRSSSKSV
jgi:hypothetical protein